MPHQDEVLAKCSELQDAMQWLLEGISWDRALHHSCSWTFHWLVVTVLAWVWSSESNLGERFKCAQRFSRHLCQRENVSTSWQAFVEILGRHTDYMRLKLTEAFRRRMAEQEPEWTTYGFVIFGIDGSKAAVPRTESNEEAFTTDGKSKNQRRSKRKRTKNAQKLSKSPHILMTTLFHIGLAMPWNWRLSGMSGSERGHVLEMLDELPENSLLVGDAGFVGYEFLSKALSSGSSVLVRVGSNVTLLRELGYARERNGTVYIWPDHVSKKQQQPPLVFRLIIFQGPRHPIYLITSILDPERLSDDQVMSIYRSRWEIEVYHRHLKQTFGRRKLLSRKAENALVELTWGILGFWAMTLFAAAEFIEHAIQLPTMSSAKVIRAFQHTLRDYLHESDTTSTLKIRIRHACKDSYQRRRPKASRDYPRKRRYKSPGPPEIVKATEEQRRRAKLLGKASLAA